MIKSLPPNLYPYRFIVIVCVLGGVGDDDGEVATATGTGEFSRKDILHNRILVYI